MASNRENETLEQSARRILVLQAILAMLVIASVIAYRLVIDGLQQGFSQGLINGMGIGYGAILGMTGTLISKRSADRSSQAAIAAPGVGMAPVYMGLINKLLIVAGGLAFGLVILGLEPIYIASGYFVTQLAVVATAVKSA